LNFSFSSEPIEADTGGALRAVDVSIAVDSRMSQEEQMHSVCYEVLSAYMDPIEERREFFLEVADTLMDAFRAISSPT